MDWFGLAPFSMAGSQHSALSFGVWRLASFIVFFLKKRTEERHSSRGLRARLTPEWYSISSLMTVFLQRKACSVFCCMCLFQLFEASYHWSCSLETILLPILVRLMKTIQLSRC